MRNIIRDASLDADRHLAILEVFYPEPDEWDTDAFNELKADELDKIRAEGAVYDRETWFRQEPYFRYFRKFKKTSPVMMQVESFLLKGRPFPEGRYNNAVAFLTELKTRCLLGSHDADRIKGDLIIYSETAKTPFPSIHGGEAHSYLRDVTCRDDESIVVSMIAGADARTCLSDESRHVLYFAFGTPGMGADELNGYLNEYVKTIPENEIRNYCANTSLNALLNHYQGGYVKLKTRIKWASLFEGVHFINVK